MRNPEAACKEPTQAKTAPTSPEICQTFSESEPKTLSNYLGERTPERLGDQRTEDAGNDGEVDDVGTLGEVVDEGFGEKSAGGQEDDGHVVEAKEFDHDRQDNEDADHFTSTKVGTETRDMK